MTRGAAPVLGWAAFLTVLLGVLVAWSSHDWLAKVVFAGAVLGAWSLAVVMLRPRRERVRVLPELSLSTIVVSVGVALLAGGALLGLWLLLIGAGVTLAGAAGLVRELLDARRQRGAEASQ